MGISITTYASDAGAWDATVLKEEGHPTEQYGGNASTDIIYRVHWDERIGFRDALLGSVIWTGAGTIELHAAHFRPEAPTLFCQHVSISPYLHSKADSDNLQLNAEWARVVARYAPYLGNQGAEGMIVQENLRPTAEFCTANANGLYWTQGDDFADNPNAQDPIGQVNAPAYVRRRMEWTFTICKYPYGAISPQYYDYMGCINAEAMRSRTYGLNFPEKTVLYHAPTFLPDQLPDGTPCIKLQCAFTVQDADWNLFPRSNRVKSDNGGVALVPIYLNDADNSQFKPYVDRYDLNLLIVD